LRLPYFWDEAGYYIPAAHDFFLGGHLIPTSTLTNAHPPLPEIYLAIWWKVFGFFPLVTRLAMLAVAAFALKQVFAIAWRIANREVAVAAVLCCAVYPVFFAQSSLAHSDLPAMALTLLGLRLYLDNKWWQCGVAFAFAALSKETAILVPAVLVAWTIGEGVYRKRGGQWRAAGWLIASLLPLCGWYLYHYARTGFAFGNPEFVRYNVASTLSPLRFVLALWQRTWQVFGHMNMWVLTALTGAAMLLPALVEEDGDSRPRIEISTQLLFLALIVAHIVAYSILGGALLSRYLMPVIPLVIIIGISTLWRRVREWKWLVGFVCLVFVVGWFVNPPYRFAPEDNLNYADFVRLHQDAIRFLQGKQGIETVLTAWPMSDELQKPELGYVAKPPVRVMTIENFSFDQIMRAQQQPYYGAVIAFSTKYEPPRTLLHWRWWDEQNVRFFDYHTDLPPEVISRMLGGTIVMQESSNGQWVAVIEMERTRNASVSHEGRDGRTRELGD
jgi:4-amino-4-deoxy-L-arabinose transferase-like glycosyltransferase